MVREERSLVGLRTERCLGRVFRPLLERVDLLESLLRRAGEGFDPVPGREGDPLGVLRPTESLLLEVTTSKELREAALKSVAFPVGGVLATEPVEDPDDEMDMDMADGLLFLVLVGGAERAGTESNPKREGAEARASW